MRYKQIMLLICILTCVLFSVSCVFANDAMNETIGHNVEELQLSDANATSLTAGDSSSASVVYFDASAASDGDGSKSNPYKVYKSDRIDFGTTAYFADGVYDITDANAIHSSSAYRTTFIGQSIDKTILRSNLANKFDFTVTDNSYLVLDSLTMMGVHINNQANLIAKNVEFKNSKSFNPDYPPSLSYSYISKVYDSTYGGVIICDTPNSKVTTLNFTDCRFNSNSAISGGVIATYNSVAYIQNCVFYNSTSTRFGGVIYAIKSTLNIRDSSFEKSSAKYGGSIYANSTNVVLKNSQFTNSKASSFGGAIASFSSKLDIDHVDFTDYASIDDAGGAIYSISGTLNVKYSTFKNGYADFGGAICNLKTDSTIANSEFTNNRAQYYGGSIYNMYGNLAINGNVFNTTSAVSGGTVFNRLSDSFNLASNSFIDSTADEGDIVFIDGGKVSVVQKSNTYDASKLLLKYGNVYDSDYYESVPIISYSPEAMETMPSSYDSRKYGYVTPAKDQIQGGNCWAFSGIATLEACLKKATGVAYDFSEENVKNLMYEYSMFDSDTVTNVGGNLYMFIAYLAGWFGPTYEENDMYDDFSSLSVLYDALVHVQNVYILPERESFIDNDFIKKAVMDYGAVSIAIDLSETQGHAVTIVGWDDEFTSSDFLGNKAVGAWIIKNSWGSEWGYDGFGYLSYQQPIGYGYTFIFNDDRGYSNVYQYDFAGKSGFHTVDSSEVYVKNKFTAKNDEILSAFSTYFDEASNYTASIYLNGNLVATQSGFSETGYYTIPLTKEVSLKKGDSFEVVVKFFNGAPVYIPLCGADEMNKITFDKGISYYSVDGKNWKDLYEFSSPSVACIKAFTRMKALNKISISVNQSGGSSSSTGSFDIDEPVSIQLNLPQYYVVGGVKHPVDGIVSFKINDKEYFATVKNGQACLNVTFDKEGTYDVSAQFKSSRVTSNLISFKVKVVKTDESNMVLEADDISKFYGGSEKYVATLTNAGKAMSGVNVKITAAGKSYTVKTDSKGQAVLDLNLPVGTYNVVAQYGSKTASSTFTVLTTINVNDLTQDFMDSEVTAALLNTDGNVLTNTKVTFSVGLHGVNSIPREFYGTTDKAGSASAKVNLYTGKYSVSVTNPINNEKREFVLDIVPIDSKCSLSVTQSGSAVTINASVSPVVSSGYVNFLLNGKIYKVNVETLTIDSNKVAVASLKLDNLAVGKYNVNAVFSGDDNLRVSSDSRDFSVTKNPYQLHSSNYWSYYGGVGTIAQITDAKGNPVKGQTVSATIQNKTYKSTTDEEGNAIFNLDLEVGNYTVLFEYNGQSLLKYVFVYSTIDIATLSADYMDSKIGAYFTSPYEGDDLNGLDVKFIVAGKTYTAKTDSNGYASVDVDLPVGTHTITAINLCNNEKKQSKIKIFKTTPSVNLTKTKRGDGILLTATIKQSSAIGNVVFTMGSKKYTVAVLHGSAILALNVLDEGSYEVYANYIGDSNFNNILSSTLKFDYAHTDYSLLAPVLTKYYGGAEKFKVTLKNYNNPVSNEIIDLTVKDKEYKIKTDTLGVASFDANLDAGTHSVKCTYEDAIASSEITIKSTINIVSGAAGVSHSKLSAEILDGSGNPVKNRQVTFKAGSKELKATTDNWGVATLDSGLDKGNYTVSIINPVTGETRQTTLIITKATPSLTLTPTKENGMDVLKAVLPKTATGDIDFVLNNGEMYSFELQAGAATLSGLNPGEYTVDVTYNGNDEFNPVSKSIKFKVSSSSLASVLTASKITTTYGTAKNLVITLKDAKGNILAGRKVTVVLNSKNYEATVASDGEAIVTVPANLVPKTYTATVTYAGEKNIQGKTINVNVVVNKAKPKLTASKKTFKASVKIKKYTVTLKTNKNKVYKNQKITIKVNGKTYSAKTNAKGKATLKINKLTKKGTFTAKVKYSGNSKYKAVTKSVKITVK